MPSLPISSALSEAEPTSLQDLFSRNPETLSEVDLEAMIALIRDQRERIERTPGPIRQSRVKAPAPHVSPEDFGL